MRITDPEHGIATTLTVVLLRKVDDRYLGVAVNRRYFMTFWFEDVHSLPDA